MKIVHCIWSFNTGGSETMLIDIANEQAKTENVYVIIVNDSYQQFLIDKLSSKVKVIFNNRKQNSRSLWPIIRLNLTLHRLQPDVVHMHNAIIPKVIMPLSNYTSFLTVHALNIPLKAVKPKINLIAISEAVREDILRRSNYNIVTIPNGINVNAIKKRDLYGFNKKMRIVQVARLDAEKKGQDILINAIALLKSRGIRNIEVDFIGEGFSFNTLKALTEKLDLTDSVNFLGLRDRDYIYNNLKHYDLMCHPSRCEGFGLTVAEGMAAMLPVLVSNEGGPYELIKKGKLGTAFKTNDVEDCANKIEYIYHHYTELLTLVNDAYKDVCMHYSIERMVKEYMNYYKSNIME